MCAYLNITSDVLWKDNLIAYNMVLILTYSDGEKLSFTYDELYSKQKNINLRSCPATNFCLARDRYSYAVMEMKPTHSSCKMTPI